MLVMIKKNKKMCLSVVLGVLLGVGIYLGISYLNRPVTLAESREFYGEYIKDMNAYGLKDPEKLLTAYFSDRFKDQVNVANVKRDFKSMDVPGVSYRGEVVSGTSKKSGKKIELAVSEWQEKSGKKVAKDMVFLGVYVIERESGRLVISSVAANDVTESK